MNLPTDLGRTNRTREVRDSYRRAIGRETDDAIRTFLQDRLAALACPEATCDKSP